MKGRKNYKNLLIAEIRPPNQRQMKKTVIKLGSGHQKRKQWFIDRIGKRVFRPPVNCQCDSCKSGHLNGILILDETHADCLYSCEGELGIRYNDKSLPI